MILPGSVLQLPSFSGNVQRSAKITPMMTFPVLPSRKSCLICGYCNWFPANKTGYTIAGVISIIHWTLHLRTRHDGRRHSENRVNPDANFAHDISSSWISKENLIMQKAYRSMNAFVTVTSNIPKASRQSFENDWRSRPISINHHHYHHQSERPSGYHQSLAYGSM